MTIDELRDALPDKYSIDAWAVSPEKIGYELTDDDFFGVVFYTAEKLEKYLKEENILSDQ